jgi:hypothetical protein
LSEKEEKAIHAWVCAFCGKAYEYQQEAERCYDSHQELVWEPVWGGIGSGSDMPLECIIKKIERGFITEIATYTLSQRKKVKMRIK